MKKNRRSKSWDNYVFKKLWRIMRIGAILLLMGMMQVYAVSSYSQEAVMSLDVKTGTVLDVIKQIEAKTEYKFFFSPKSVDVNRTVSLKLENKKVREILDQLFVKSNTTYQLVDRSIVLSQETKPLRSTQDVQTIKGKVTDQSGESLPGVSVVVKGTTIGTVTDIDGKYSISVPAKAQTIVFSFVGMTTQEVMLNGQTLFNIVLVQDAIGLDEVVAIGYGIQKKSDLTGAVASVSSDRLSTESNTNIGQALQGRMAGVEIVSAGGSPGSGNRIMIRGIGTLNNSSPLYVIDGIYMDNMDFINPNDIESINVLKDASASAIYGSRAANGVVLITTKSGEDSQGIPTFNFSANVGVASPAKYMDMLDAKGAAEVINLARKNSGLDPILMLSDLETKEDNDWQDIMMGPALRHNYNLSMSGGTKHYTYYTGLGYSHEDGTIKGTSYERINGQFKSTYKKGWFSAGNNILINYEKRKPTRAYARGGLYGMCLQALPTMAKYNEDNLGGYGNPYGDVVNLVNPLAVTDPYIFDAYNKSWNAFAHLWAQAEVVEGLKFKIDVTPSMNVGEYMLYTGKFDMGGDSSTKNSLNRSQSMKQNILIENTLNYEKAFGDHKITALVGYSYQNANYRYIGGMGSTMPVGLTELDATTLDRTISGNSNESSLVSILSRAFYSYKNKYLFTATLRRDASSKFAKNRRVGNFPSFSVGYNVAEERFLENVNWLDALKIRGGYGELGNQEIGNYKYTSTVKTGINYADGNGDVYQGAFPREFVNPVVEWEKTTMVNVGVDLTALSGKITATLDLYKKTTDDILLAVPIPYSTGGTNDPIQNIGKISNKGLEFTLGWRDNITKDFSYTIDFNGNFIKNNVENLASEDQVINSGKSFRGSYTTKTLKDYPIGGFWLLKTAGLFPDQASIDAHSKDGVLIQPQALPGDVKFVDANDDGVINDSDRVYCGSPFPKFTFGFSNGMKYKNFDLRIDIQGVFGNKILNDTRSVLTGVTKGSNYLASTLDYWTPENKDASQPYLRYDDPNGNYRTNSDRNLESGDYIRVRSIQMGYNLPVERLANKLSKFRVYLSLENPFTFTSYSGVSPDYNSFNSYSRGNDFFAYPTSKIYMMGINVSF